MTFEPPAEYTVDPRTIGDVVDTFRRWLHLPDADALLAALGAVAANRLPGDPVWFVLVGSPGSGKTEILQSLSGLADIHVAATLTEPALLSGTPKREAKGAKGGLLREIGEYGIIVAKDFTSVLSMHRDARAALLAALREVYDGSWTRHVGTDGGKTLHWSGKVGLLAGCTPTIDRAHGVMGSMGERFILFRLPETDGEEQLRRALGRSGHEVRMRKEFADVVAGLFANANESPSAPEPLTNGEHDRLLALATLVCRARSAVERDGYSREIELIPGAEAPARLGVALDRLRAGLRTIGVGRGDAWRIVAKCAMDSIPALRRQMMELLVDGERRTTTAVCMETGYPNSTARRALEDLHAHGLVSRHKEGRADAWELSEWAISRYGATVPEMSGDIRSATASGSISPSRISNDKSGKVGQLLAGPAPLPLQTRKGSAARS